MGEMGFILQFSALLLGIGAFLIYLLSFGNSGEKYEKTANYLLIGQMLAATVASLILVFALTTNYFKMEYVAQYTDLSLPFIYKLSAFWAGQAGSLFFWAWLITVFTVIELYRIRNYPHKYKSIVFATTAATASFFLIMTCFVINPFKELDFFPPNGQGMNPLLQNPGMIYHPPLLYLGFVGFTIPFGHALASLILNDTSNFWIKSVRKISLITWIFLTLGIVLGAQWAYVELGWGGYWAWDPVENASLLPWLTGTAFIHSSIMFEKRKKLKIWTFVLIFLTFELCILSTFLTRSGIIDSVHSFGKSPLGSFFIWFMVLSSAIYLSILIYKIRSIKDEPIAKFFSKEGMFYLANWLFVGLMLVILLGSTLPIFSEILFSDKTSVNISYYNNVTIPFFLIILLLSGFGSISSLGKSSITNILKEITPAIIFMFIVSGIIYTLGYTQKIPLFLFAFASFNFFIILTSIIKDIIKRGANSVFKNRRFYGGLIVHIGVVLITFGIVASSFYKTEKEEVVTPGTTIQFGKYKLNVGEIMFKEQINYVSAYTPIKVYNSDKYMVTMKPERRFYNNNEESFGEVAIYTKPQGDLYLILASYSKPENIVGVIAVFQPLVVWIWVGCILMLIGGIYSLSAYRKYE